MTKSPILLSLRKSTVGKNYIITELDESRKEEHGQLIIDSFYVHYAKKGWTDKYMPFSGK